MKLKNCKNWYLIYLKSVKKLQMLFDCYKFFYLFITMKLFGIKNVEDIFSCEICYVKKKI